MAPRRYTLGKRAAAVAETRQCIIQAAVALYQEQGISNVSMHDVARRADVAPATVLNHFPSPDDLAEAVVQQITADLQRPSETIFEGLNTMHERIMRLARELSAFYQRSEPWYRIYQRDNGRSRVFAQSEERFFLHIDQLMRQALGPLASDQRALAALRSFMSPATFGGLEAQGFADLVPEVLEPWLERRLQQG